ncbi:MAG: outer membrane protein assembly factor BamE [Reyranellaceae bacterium]
MKRTVLALSIVLPAAACGPAARSLDQVQPGMTPQQVQAIMGPPQAVAYSSGKHCAYYALLKDFWSRVPWSVSDRYFVCYDGDKVDSFGRVDTATPNVSLVNGR